MRMCFQWRLPKGRILIMLCDHLQGRPRAAHPAGSRSRSWSSIMTPGAFPSLGVPFRPPLLAVLVVMVVLCLHRTRRGQICLSSLSCRILPGDIARRPLPLRDNPEAVAHTTGDQADGHA